MTDFCFSLSLDGAEQALRSQTLDTATEAVSYARAMLSQAVAKRQLEAAYCVVYESAGTDTEPLGVWDWSRGAPEPVWTPNE